MIRKVKKEEYLKGYGVMSDKERKDYQNRAGEWLSGGGRLLLEMTERPMAKSQNIMLLSARWKEPEVRAFAEGARLMTALVDVADTWLPTQLYAKSAYRAVRQMNTLLGEVSGDGDVIAMQQAKKALRGLRETPAAKAHGTAAAGKAHGTVATGKAQGAVTTGKATGTGAQQNLKPESLKPESSKVAPPRPRHIDQYVHLLPEATQKRAAGYGELMREFDISREKLRIVMDDVHASDRDREQWAKKVSRLDEKIGDIRRELDMEWEKVAASGCVVMDDLGMAHLVDATDPVHPLDGRGVAITQTGGVAKGTEKTALKTDEKANDLRRAALLRKWLIDTRYGNKDAEKRAKYQEKWREKYHEMVRLGGMESVTEKVREAAKHYEIDINALSLATNETI